MKVTLYIDARIGNKQRVKTDNGTVTAQAVYEARFFNRVGYLEKGKKTWTAYGKGQGASPAFQIGVYTHRSVALAELLYKTIAF